MHDFLLALAVAWMLFPVAFFWAGCPCCGSVDMVPCSNCLGGECAETYEVIISGMANGTCSTCAGLDGTYVLGPMAQTLTVCRNAEAAITECTSYAFIRFNITSSGVGCQFLTSAAGLLNQWFKGYTPPIDETSDGDGGCLFSSMNVPFANEFTAECSAVSATCTVSYL